MQPPPQPPTMTRPEPKEPRLLPSLRMSAGVTIIIVVEVCLFFVEIAASILIATSMESYPGIFGFILIGFGVWALLWLHQARVTESPNKTLVYIIWKSAVVVLQGIGMFAFAAIIGVMEGMRVDWDNIHQETYPHLRAILYVYLFQSILSFGLGIWFLIFVGRLRAFYQAKLYNGGTIIHAPNTTVVYQYQHPMIPQYYQQGIPQQMGYPLPPGAAPNLPSYEEVAGSHTGQSPPAYTPKH